MPPIGDVGDGARDGHAISSPRRIVDAHRAGTVGVGETQHLQAGIAVGHVGYGPGESQAIGIARCIVVAYFHGIHVGDVKHPQAAIAGGNVGVLPRDGHPFAIPRPVGSAHQLRVRRVGDVYHPQGGVAIGDVGVNVPCRCADPGR